MRSAFERACEYQKRAEEIQKLLDRTDEPVAQKFLVQLLGEYRALANELSRQETFALAAMLAGSREDSPSAISRAQGAYSRTPSL